MPARPRRARIARLAAAAAAAGARPLATSPDTLRRPPSLPDLPTSSFFLRLTGPPL